MPMEQIETRMGSIKRMLLIGAPFAAVGYLLVGMALSLDPTQFHPAIDEVVRRYTDHSLAGGGPDGAGAGGIAPALTAIHQWPSMLPWLERGGVGNVLVGIFIALAALVRTLTPVPVRLSHGMARARPADSGSVGDAVSADD
jgi:hypothetical protein